MRSASGVSRDRLASIIVNVLHKFIAPMGNQNVVVSVTGGMQLREPGADLAIAVAITSSYYNVAVPRDMAVIGEVCHQLIDFVSINQVSSRAGQLRVGPAGSRVRMDMICGDRSDVVQLQSLSLPCWPPCTHPFRAVSISLARLWC